jgi:hypothetical protein
MIDIGPGLTIPLIVLSRGPVGAAFAERLRGGAVEPDPALLGEVDQLKTRLAEVEERLDFAERLLARRESTDQLPGGVQR